MPCIVSCGVCLRQLALLAAIPSLIPHAATGSTISPLQTRFEATKFEHAPEQPILHDSLALLGAALGLRICDPPRRSVATEHRTNGRSTSEIQTRTRQTGLTWSPQRRHQRRIDLVSSSLRAISSVQATELSVAHLEPFGKKP